MYMRRKMDPCIAYEELVGALEENFLVAAGIRLADPGERLEWLLVRHNTDGSAGCDWCVLAEEIRRLRNLAG
jgi:hypothetical protein